MVWWSVMGTCRRMPVPPSSAVLRASDPESERRLKPMGEEGMRHAMLCCAFASALLSHTAVLSQYAIAQEKLSADAKADGHGQVSVLAGAAKAEKGKEAPIPAVDKETLSLYPTAAQCGECHKQIYEEWASSQHAYA